MQVGEASFLCYGLMNRTFVLRMSFNHNFAQNLLLVYLFNNREVTIEQEFIEFLAANLYLQNLESLDFFSGLCMWSDSNTFILAFVDRCKA